MKIIVAPDSFKHTLSAQEVARIICGEGRRILSDSQFIEFPVSDGGEGFLDTIAGIYSEKMALHEYETLDPLGRKIRVKIGILNRRIGIVEAASTIGVTLIHEEERDPFECSSFGLGQLIEQVLSMNVEEFWIGIGGTATIDGGMGLLSALGVIFKTKHGQVLRGNGRQLSEVDRLELGSKVNRLRNMKIKVFCDIDNRLLGSDGAISRYGPQKGASPDMINRLQKGMENYIAVLEKTTNVSLDRTHLGAGGGIAAGLHSIFGAEVIPGIEGVLELCNFGTVISAADLVITGEGRTDGQTRHGKAPIGVLKYCQKEGVPAILLSGCIDFHEFGYDSNGFDASLSTVAISNTSYDDECGPRLKMAAGNLFSLIKIGMAIENR